MTYKQHINNANNFSVITSYEFSDIESYLTSKITKPSSVLPIMKNSRFFPSLEYNEAKNYYTVSQDEAWKYFSELYPKPIATRKIRDMNDLLYQATNWVQSH